MEIKIIEEWAKPVVDSEVDSEMYSRLADKCKKGTSLIALEEEMSGQYFFADSVYVESMLALAYFFWHHGHHAHSVFYNCKRMIESGVPLAAMMELTESKEYLKAYAIGIRLFYEKVLSGNYGAWNEKSAFAILEKAFSE